MFHDVESPLERIIYVVSIQKSNFDASRENDVLCERIVLITDNLTSGRLKNDFG
jgi:hypothetical protein